MKPRLLDLFCGAGGAAMGYSRAGFEVVGVDIEPQPNYPFEFYRLDALKCLRFMLAGPAECAEEMGGPELRDFDAIHASPPCQFYTELNVDKGKHPDLIATVRELLKPTGLPYVIENVVGARDWMVGPLMLCGSAFPELHVQRHRLFETTFPAMSLQCRHDRPPKFKVYEHGKWYESPWAKVYGSGGGKAREHWGEAMGIDWMTDEEIVEAIPPAYTEHIGSYLMMEEVKRIQAGVAA